MVIDLLNSGPILLSILNIMERYRLGVDGPTPLNLHRLVEAMKFGYAQRTELGDLDMKNNATFRQRVLEIISKDYASQVRHNISDVRIIFYLKILLYRMKSIYACLWLFLLSSYHIFKNLG
jgi:gamma-glutamyltranspeptidase